jgi:hypothetical protein
MSGASTVGADAIATCLAGSRRGRTVSTFRIGTSSNFPSVPSSARLSHSGTWLPIAAEITAPSDGSAPHDFPNTPARAQFAGE